MSTACPIPMADQGVYGDEFGGPPVNERFDDNNSDDIHCPNQRGIPKTRRGGAGNRLIRHTLDDEEGSNNEEMFDDPGSTPIVEPPPEENLVGFDVGGVCSPIYELNAALKIEGCSAQGGALPSVGVGSFLLATANADQATALVDLVTEMSQQVNTNSDVEHL